MADNPAGGVGTCGWIDLAVPDADGLRAFYEKVVGWTSEPLDMGGYADYVMKTPAGDGVAGVCHARGPNAAFPPVWMVYFRVADVEASAAACRAGGGEVLTGPKAMGGGRVAVVRDPAGAVCALFQGE